MSTSQLFLGTIIIFIIYRTFLSYKHGNLSKTFTLIWLILWIIVLVFIFEQNSLIKIAHFIGISRGVDLVIYLSIILLFYLIFKIFYSLSTINQKLTKIIRQEAINHVLKNHQIMKSRKSKLSKRRIKKT